MIELPVATRHRRDMTEKNVDGDVKPEQTNIFPISGKRIEYAFHFLLPH